jgi:Ca-activated chloride channel family protein
VLKETYDKNVVANVLDGLPMYVAFEPGATDLNKGVAATVDLARPWARKSATLIVISDGDAEHPPAPVARPDSIADAIVIGVGDPNRGSIVGGHNSRQDASSLKQLAARLGGVYHEGNQHHLPSEILDKLTMINPRTGAALGLREGRLAFPGIRLRHPWPRRSRAQPLWPPWRVRLQPPRRFPPA